jgi:hypothetical protein
VDFTAHQARIAIRSPQALIRQRLAEARLPGEKGRPHDPQRKAIERAIGDYFAGGRDGRKLVDDFLERTSTWKSASSRASSIANAAAMLGRFADLDQDQPAPERWFLPAVPIEMWSHRLILGADLVYREDDGIRVRQLLTDTDMTRTEHLRLFASLTARHVEARPDAERVVRVDAWRLRRNGKVLTYDRAFLVRFEPALATALRTVAAAFGEQAAKIG